MLKDKLIGWQLNYVLKAPFNGTVTLLQRLNENDFIGGETELFAVLPQNNELIGFVEITTQGLGKIKKGQRVNIQLANYPSHEFGQVHGEVLSITELPQRKYTNENLHLVKITLPYGLLTTYQKELEMSAEMFGNAEIVTEEARIIERILINLKHFYFKIIKTSLV